MQIFGTKAFKVLTGTAVAAAMLLPSMSLAAATTYTPVAGGDFTFKKTLTYDADAILPDITFDFAIVGGTAIEATTNHVAVYSGTDAARVKTGTAADSASLTNTDLENAIDSVSFGAADTDASGETTKDATVDLSGVYFNEPGVYRYEITEVVDSDNEAHGVTYDDTSRYLDVYVTDSGSGVLTVSGYVLHSQEDYVPFTTGSADPTAKSEGFTNDYETENLTIALNVDGNQASRDEYFEVKLSITGAIPGTEYTVDLTNADATTSVNGASSAAHTNPASITTDTSGKAEVSFWLQNGQSVDVLGLSYGTTYTVTVSNEAGDLVADGYVAAVEADPATEGTANGDTFTDTDGIKEDTTVTFTLTKNGIIPTGVILAVAPAVAVFVIGGLGVTGIALKNRKKNDEE